MAERRDRYGNVLDSSIAPRGNGNGRGYDNGRAPRGGYDGDSSMPGRLLGDDRLRYADNYMPPNTPITPRPLGYDGEESPITPGFNRYYDGASSVGGPPPVTPRTAGYDGAESSMSFGTPRTERFDNGPTYAEARIPQAGRYDPAESSMTIGTPRTGRYGPAEGSVAMGTPRTAQFDTAGTPVTMGPPGAPAPGPYDNTMSRGDYDPERERGKERQMMMEREKYETERGMRPPPGMEVARQSTEYLSSSGTSTSSYLDISHNYPTKGWSFKTFFRAPSEKKPKKRRSKRVMRQSNSSSSSLDGDLAYGTGFLRYRRKKAVRARDGRDREIIRYKSSKESLRETRSPTSERRPTTDAEILAVGAGLAKLARDHNKLDLKNGKKGRKSESGAGSGRNGGRGLDSSRAIPYETDPNDDEGWESASDDESEASVDSGLAFGGEAPAPAKAPARRSFFGGKKKHGPMTRKSSIVDPRLFGPQNSLNGVLDRPVGYEEVHWESSSDFGQESYVLYSDSQDERYGSDRDRIGRTQSVASGSQASLQHVFPVPTSDPSRFDVARRTVSEANSARPVPVPIQQPQPITPVSQSVYNEPSYVRSASGGILKSSSNRQSLAGAALAGVAGAAIGAVLASSQRDDMNDAREDDKRESRREAESVASRREDERRERRRAEEEFSVSEGSIAKRREKNKDDRPERDEKREQTREIERVKDDARSITSNSSRDTTRDSRRDDPDAAAEERARRREARRQERRDADRVSDRYDDKRSNVESEVSAPPQPPQPVNPFQYQVEDSPVNEPSQIHPQQGAAPTVVTVDREPNFSRKSTSSNKDTSKVSRTDAGRDRGADEEDRGRRYRDSERVLHEAERIYEEAEHSTAPIDAVAIAAAAAAVGAEGLRQSRAEKRRGERRTDADDQNSTPGQKSEIPEEEQHAMVMAEADRAYREIVMARKVAAEVRRSRSPSPEPSVINKYEVEEEVEEPTRIVTPPGMHDRKKKGPYDAPNADFTLDYVMTPRDLKVYSIPAMRYKRDHADLEGPFMIRDPDAKLPRPLLNLIQPTPVPTPSPEKQFASTKTNNVAARSEEREDDKRRTERKVEPKSQEREQRREQVSSRTEKERSYDDRWSDRQGSRAQDREQPREPVSSRPQEEERGRRGSRPTPAVILGPRGDVIRAADAPVSSPTQSTVSKGVTWGVNETKHFEVESPTDGREEFNSQPDGSEKSRSGNGWGAIAAGVMGAGAGAVLASSSESARDSKVTDDRDAPRKSRLDDRDRNQGPYEYRGVVVEPGTPDERPRRESPPKIGPKPVTAPSGHVPGAFDDDLDFTAHVAAGLQDTGFNPDLVIDDPAFRKRDSPAGSNEFVYKGPWAETVSDLQDAPATDRGYVIGEVAETPKDWTSVSPAAEEEPSKPTKKERWAGEEFTPMSEIIIEEPEGYFDEAPRISNKEQRRREREATKPPGLERDMSSFVEVDPVSPFADPPQSYIEQPVEDTPRKSQESSRSTRDNYDPEIAPSLKKKLNNRSSARDEDDESPRGTNRRSLDSVQSFKNGEEFNPRDSKRDSGFEGGRSSKSSRSSKESLRNKNDQYDEVDPAQISLPQTSSEENSYSSEEAPPKLPRLDKEERTSSLPRSIMNEERSSSLPRSIKNDDVGFRRPKKLSRSSTLGDLEEHDFRRPRKLNRSSTIDDLDDLKAVAMAGIPEEGGDSKKERRTGGLFSFFGGSRSGSGSREDSSKLSRDDPDDVKKKKKKRSDSLGLIGRIGSPSQATSGLTQVSSAETNGQFTRMDSTTGLQKDGEKQGSKSSEAKKDSFLDNAGILGAGAGLAAGAVAVVAQHHQYANAANENENEIEIEQNENENLGEPGREENFDLEISEREFRPSIDPQYGDLLPLPPSGPVSPIVDAIDDLPELPESRPTTPDSERRTPKEKTPRSRRSLQETPLKTSSPSAVPLKFVMGNRSISSSPVSTRAPQIAIPGSPNAESTTFSRPKSRPKSWDKDTKEYKPLYLLETNRRGSYVQPEEQIASLPQLPPSRTSSQLDVANLPQSGVFDEEKLDLHRPSEDPLEPLSMARTSPSSDDRAYKVSTPTANTLKKDLAPSAEFKQDSSLTLETQKLFSHVSPHANQTSSPDLVAQTIGAAALATATGSLIASQISSDDKQLTSSPQDIARDDKSGHDNSPLSSSESHDIAAEREKALLTLSGISEPDNQTIMSIEDEVEPTEEFTLSKSQKKKDRKKAKAKALLAAAQDDGGDDVQVAQAEVRPELTPEMESVFTPIETHAFEEFTTQDSMEKKSNKGKAAAEDVDVDATAEPEPESFLDSPVAIARDDVAEAKSENVSSEQPTVIEESREAVEEPLAPVEEPVEEFLSPKSKKNKKKGKNISSFEPEPETEQPADMEVQEPAPTTSENKSLVLDDNVTEPQEQVPENSNTREIENLEEPATPAAENDTFDELAMMPLTPKSKKDKKRDRKKAKAAAAAAAAEKEMEAAESTPIPETPVQEQAPEIQQDVEPESVPVPESPSEERALEVEPEFVSLSETPREESVHEVEPVSIPVSETPTEEPIHKVELSSEEENVQIAPESVPVPETPVEEAKEITPESIPVPETPTEERAQEVELPNEEETKQIAPESVPVSETPVEEAKEITPESTPVPFEEAQEIAPESIPVPETPTEERAQEVELSNEEERKQIAPASVTVHEDPVEETKEIAPESISVPDTPTEERALEVEPEVASEFPSKFSADADPETLIQQEAQEIAPESIPMPESPIEERTAELIPEMSPEKSEEPSTLDEPEPTSLETPAPIGNTDDAVPINDDLVASPKSKKDRKKARKNRAVSLDSESQEPVVEAEPSSQNVVEPPQEALEPFYETVENVVEPSQNAPEASFSKAVDGTTPEEPVSETVEEQAPEDPFSKSVEEEAPKESFYKAIEEQAPEEPSSKVVEEQALEESFSKTIEEEAPKESLSEPVEEAVQEATTPAEPTEDTPAPLSKKGKKKAKKAAAAAAALEEEATNEQIREPVADVESNETLETAPVVEEVIQPEISEPVVPLSPKKSKKKSKKNKALEDQSSTQVQPEIASLVPEFEKPTPMVGPGGWPVTPATPWTGATAEISRSSDKDYFPPAETVLPAAAVGAAFIGAELSKDDSLAQDKIGSEERKRSGLSRSTTAEELHDEAESPQDVAEDSTSKDLIEEAKPDRFSLDRQLPAESVSKSQNDVKRDSAPQTPTEETIQAFEDLEQSAPVESQDLEASATVEEKPDVITESVQDENQLALANQSKEQFEAASGKEEKSADEPQVDELSSKPVARDIVEPADLAISQPGPIEESRDTRVSQPEPIGAATIELVDESENLTTSQPEQTEETIEQATAVEPETEFAPVNNTLENGRKEKEPAIQTEETIGESTSATDAATEPIGQDETPTITQEPEMQDAVKIDVAPLDSITAETPANIPQLDNQEQEKIDGAPVETAAAAPAPEAEAEIAFPEEKADEIKEKDNVVEPTPVKEIAQTAATEPEAQIALPDEKTDEIKEKDNLMESTPAEETATSEVLDAPKSDDIIQPTTSEPIVASPEIELTLPTKKSKKDKKKKKQSSQLQDPADDETKAKDISSVIESSAAELSSAPVEQTISVPNNEPASRSVDPLATPLTPGFSSLLGPLSARRKGVLEMVQELGWGKKKNKPAEPETPIRPVTAPEASQLPTVPETPMEMPKSMVESEPATTPTIEEELALPVKKTKKDKKKGKSVATPEFTESLSAEPEQAETSVSRETEVQEPEKPITQDVETPPTPIVEQSDAPESSGRRSMRDKEKRPSLQSFLSQEAAKAFRKPSLDGTPRVRSFSESESAFGRSTEPIVGRSIESAVERPAEPVVERTVENVSEPAIEKSVESGVEQAVEQASEPTVEQSIKPVSDSTEPVTEQPSEHVIEQTSEPTIEQSSEPTIEQPIIEQSVIKQPVIEQPSEPIIEQSSEPTVERTIAPTYDSIEPIIEKPIEPTSEQLIEASSESNIERSIEPVTETIVEQSPEPNIERSVEPIRETIVTAPVNNQDDVPETPSKKSRKDKKKKRKSLQAAALAEASAPTGTTAENIVKEQEQQPIEPELRIEKSTEPEVEIEPKSTLETAASIPIPSESVLESASNVDEPSQSAEVEHESALEIAANTPLPSESIPETATNFHEPSLPFEGNLEPTRDIAENAPIPSEPISEPPASVDEHSLPAEAVAEEPQAIPEATSSQAPVVTETQAEDEWALPTSEPKKSKKNKKGRGKAEVDVKEPALRELEPEQSLPTEPLSESVDAKQEEEPVSTAEDTFKPTLEREYVPVDEVLEQEPTVQEITQEPKSISNVQEPTSEVLTESNEPAHHEVIGSSEIAPATAEQPLEESPEAKEPAKLEVRENFESASVITPEPIQDFTPVSPKRSKKDRKKRKSVPATPSEERANPVEVAAPAQSMPADPIFDAVHGTHGGPIFERTLESVNNDSQASEVQTTDAEASREIPTNDFDPRESAHLTSPSANIDALTDSSKNTEKFSTDTTVQELARVSQDTEQSHQANVEPASDRIQDVEESTSQPVLNIPFEEQPPSEPFSRDVNEAPEVEPIVSSPKKSKKDKKKRKAKAIALAEEPIAANSSEMASIPGIPREALQLGVLGELRKKLAARNAALAEEPASIPIPETPVEEVTREIVSEEPQEEFKEEPANIPIPETPSEELPRDLAPETVNVEERTPDDLEIHLSGVPIPETPVEETSREITSKDVPVHEENTSEPTTWEEPANIPIPETPGEDASLEIAPEEVFDRESAPEQVNFKEPASIPIPETPVEELSRDMVGDEEIRTAPEDIPIPESPVEEQAREFEPEVEARERMPEPEPVVHQDASEQVDDGFEPSPMMERRPEKESGVPSESISSESIDEAAPRAFGEFELVDRTRVAEPTVSEVASEDEVPTSVMTESAEATPFQTPQNLPADARGLPLMNEDLSTLVEDVSVRNEPFSENTQEPTENMTTGPREISLEEFKAMPIDEQSTESSMAAKTEPLAVAIEDVPEEDFVPAIVEMKDMPIEESLNAEATPIEHEVKAMPIEELPKEASMPAEDKSTSISNEKYADIKDRESGFFSPVQEISFTPQQANLGEPEIAKPVPAEITLDEFKAMPAEEAPKEVQQQTEVEEASISAKRSKKDTKKRKSILSAPSEPEVPIVVSELPKDDLPTSEEPTELALPLDTDVPDTHTTSQVPQVEKDERIVPGHDIFGKSFKEKKGKEVLRSDTESGPAHPAVAVSEPRDVEPGDRLLTSPIPMRDTTIRVEPATEPDTILHQPSSNSSKHSFEQSSDSSPDLTRNVSKHDKRKRQATLDLATPMDDRQRTFWADEIPEAEIVRSAPVIEDIGKDEFYSHIASTTENAPISDFSRPAKKGKKGTRRPSGNIDDFRPPIGEDRPKEEPMQELKEAPAVAATVSAIATAALLASRNKRTGTEEFEEEDSQPAKKLSRKERKRPSIDNREPSDDKLGGAAPWEEKKPRAFEEASRERHERHDNRRGNEELFVGRTILPDPSTIDITRKPFGGLPKVAPMDTIKTRPMTPPRNFTPENIAAVPIIKPESPIQSPSPPRRSPPAHEPRGDLPEEYLTKPSRRELKDKTSKKPKNFGAPPGHLPMSIQEALRATIVEMSNKGIVAEGSPPTSPSAQWASRSKPRSASVVATSELPVRREESVERRSTLKAEDSNRDSAFGSDSPIPPQGGFQDTGYVRDSGVHMRDDSPSVRVRAPVSSSEAAIASMSWPIVDEEAGTVDLERFQRPKVVDEFKHLDRGLDSLPSQKPTEEKDVDLHRTSAIHGAHSKEDRRRSRRRSSTVQSENSDVNEKDVIRSQRLRAFPDRPQEMHDPSPVPAHRSITPEKGILKLQAMRMGSPEPELPQIERSEVRTPPNRTPPRPTEDKYRDFDPPKTPRTGDRKYTLDSTTSIAAGAAIAAAGLGFASARRISQENREYRPGSAQSQRSASNISVNRMRTPNPLDASQSPFLSDSAKTNRSFTPPLRRTARKISGDLRSLRQQGNFDPDKEPDLAFINTAGSTTSTNSANPTANEGRVRSKEMADVYVSVANF
ncbi:Involucrin repeat protein [Rutstroemia sp. NJR-2017a BVV2]|nr:Involucrin repeat protein [Rutstroemia sp. NJR-2017a BVV2]